MRFVLVSVRPIILLTLVVLGAQRAHPALARDACFSGPSAAQGATGAGDVSEAIALRAVVDSTCACAASASHGDYVDCTRGVISAARTANTIRRPCAMTLIKAYMRASCGYPATAKGERAPCVRKDTGSGKVTCSIRPTGACASDSRSTRSSCPVQTTCLDAADTDGDFLLTSSDSGECGTCRNGVVEGSEQCDATADSACPGQCLPNCQCAVCGNGSVEAPVEQCDGTEGPCPGLCSGTCSCPSIHSTTVDIPSGATPPNTPGSPGVVASNPKLLTQFGGAGFDLNRARYTRFYWDAPGLTPAAILILIPGFEGGANDFKLLAENLLQRALIDNGQILEVWGYDRRTNQLEDTVGLDIAEAAGEAQIGLDWLFGGELGLTLHPALAGGPNRRAVFYNPQDDIPFLANWTNLVFSQDIDAVVSAADAVVQNHNVFLGGHSAGTGFAARYAATDFDLTGMGPSKPGFAKLRGLVLLEGGGGSTVGAPLTTDTLDRIEAKFDGGLFAAVRDNAGRCVDGTTPCTIGTETTDCAGMLPLKCTAPTTSYAVSGLLNARILAAVEPVAIQGIGDPDGGQILLQVDQGSAGNNAINKVPDLSALSTLPQGTVFGGLGSFVDDDGLVASIAAFVATSVGASGPSIGGLTTWLDITEGVLPPTALPNNGPAPTSLPAARWGQEKEVTRFDRLLTTYYAGGSNFTDWYYPSAGPSTTSVSGICTSGTCSVGNVGASCTTNAQCSQAVNLDSTALSIGRGRRDIENLTQAANIDIPVIAFGGSNGLTTVPGAFVPFAQSIATCTAPSCDGATSRVVDAGAPNPAFPTLGGIAGGFEAYISEGFAHVDVLTAEDTADNNVLAPLAAFLARNSQP